MKIWQHWWFKTLAGLGVLMLLVVLGFFNSSLRAKNEAASYREQLEKQGEVFDVMKLAPPRLAPGSMAPWFSLRSLRGSKHYQTTH